MDKQMYMKRMNMMSILTILIDHQEHQNHQKISDMIAKAQVGSLIQWYIVCKIISVELFCSFFVMCTTASLKLSCINICIFLI